MHQIMLSHGSNAHRDDSTASATTALRKDAPALSWQLRRPGVLGWVQTQALRDERTDRGRQLSHCPRGLLLRGRRAGVWPGAKRLGGRLGCGWDGLLTLGNPKGRELLSKAAAPGLFHLRTGAT